MAGEDAAPAGADDVAERLRRLGQLGVRRGRAGLAPPIPAPKISTAPPTDPGLDLAARVAAQEIFTPAGPCLVATTHYPLDEARGGWALDAALRVSSDAAAACGRDQRLADFDFHSAAFLDTETSGLAGGAGTFAFMVGIGSFQEDGYVVRQVFMRNPAEERALLHVVGSLLAPCRELVTFNGRSFDAPLLNTRYALQRKPSPLADLSHLDLLPAARQRWRLRLSSCALSALEKDILGFRRTEQDVPGWLIPSIYQEYARSQGQPRSEVVDDMARVFYHNREDIVNM
ncbi:MAG TPA: ribonuclease H-like domain-containing protein, partial [Anaerolineae bacterium]|nr:ribonuclease H-like domain-containing protein [Anaerolineae bacterium]